MNIWCWLFGHKPLKLDALKLNGVMSYTDVLGDVVFRVEACERCHILYWTYPNDKAFRI